MNRVAIAMTLAATALAQTPPPAPVKGSISGVVRDAGTGLPFPARPLRRSRSTDLYVSRGSRKASQRGHRFRGPLLVARSRPRETEEFNAQGLGPGGIAGFGPSANKFISLSPGQEIAALDFHLRVNGEISGRVFDENKEPVPGISVFLVAREYSRGALRYVLASMATTDDQGAYMLNRVTPGRAFLVMAEKRTFKLARHLRSARRTQAATARRCSHVLSGIEIRRRRGSPRPARRRTPGKHGHPIIARAVLLRRRNARRRRRTSSASLRDHRAAAHQRSLRQWRLLRGVARRHVRAGWKIPHLRPRTRRLHAHRHRANDRDDRSFVFRNHAGHHR